MTKENHSTKGKSKDFILAVYLIGMWILWVVIYIVYLLPFVSKSLFAMQIDPLSPIINLTILLFIPIIALFLFVRITKVFFPHSKIAFYCGDFYAKYRDHIKQYFHLDWL